MYPSLQLVDTESRHDTKIRKVAMILKFIACCGRRVVCTGGVAPLVAPVIPEHNRHLSAHLVLTAVQRRQVLRCGAGHRQGGRAASPHQGGIRGGRVGRHEPRWKSAALTPWAGCRAVLGRKHGCIEQFGGFKPPHQGSWPVLLASMSEVHSGAALHCGRMRIVEFRNNEYLLLL